LPSGQTVGIPDSATVSLLALSTAVPRRQTSAKTESFISLTFGDRLAGIVGVVPDHDPELAAVDAALRVDVAGPGFGSEGDRSHAAAGPESGALMPRTTSLSETPGAAAKRSKAMSMIPPGAAGAWQGPRNLF